MPVPLSATPSIDVCPALERVEADHRPPLDPLDRGRDAQLAAGGHGVPRVESEVEEDLLNLGRVHEDGGLAAAEREREQDVLREDPPQQPLGLSHRRVEIYFSRGEGLAAREGQELARKVRSARRRLADALYIVAGGSSRRELVGEEIRVSKDGGQDIVEIVRYAAGEPS